MGGAAEEEEEEKNEAWKPASTHTQTAWLINYNTLRIMFTRTAFESNTNSIADKLQDVLNTIRIMFTRTAFEVDCPAAPVCVLLY